MGLPDAIEILPLEGPVHAQVSVPGSKSITNRALILAALAEGDVRLDDALWSEDTQVMVQCLERLGLAVKVEPCPREPGNRIITVKGCGGRFADGGSAEAPLELFVGNAGTAARFLTAMLCLGRGCYRLSGVPRMHERPQGALLQALRTLGYRIDTPNDHLPATIHGGGARAGACRVSVAESSQFASALLLAGRVGGWQIAMTGGNPDEQPYVDMTRALLRAFPHDGGRFSIEPDASSGSYFWGADAALRLRPDTAKSRIEVRSWPQSGWQIDAAFPKFLPLPRTLSRKSELGDAIMTAIAIAPLTGLIHTFTDLGRLRVQECERVLALRTELRKCGADVREEGDTLIVGPGALHGAEIETYDDHRMAMCLATLGLVVPGMRIGNPACVSKTFPGFFARLAAPPPEGLGVIIRDAATGAVLRGDALVA